jgi:hypothetical protein
LDDIKLFRLNSFIHLRKICFLLLGSKFMTISFKKFNYRVFKQPKQIKKSHYGIVAFFGRVGFLTKAFIYGTIGGLTCESAFTSTLNNESPQGVFILLGSIPNAAGRILLICILIGVGIYATWRFWEGLSGQGYESSFSKWKNFFRYRISPIASGIVYIAYGIYIITLLIEHQPVQPGSSFQSKGSCFPICWKNTVIGKIGLGLLAVAFTIATITQLIPALTGNFRNEMDFSKLNKMRIIKYPFLAFGHIGFLARAVLFFLVCFLFWKILFGSFIYLDQYQSTVGQAINSIRGTSWGRNIMRTLGIGLIMYAVFAFMCIYFKIFPTPPPSTNITKKVIVNIRHIGMPSLPTVNNVP